MQYYRHIPEGRARRRSRRCTLFTTRMSLRTSSIFRYTYIAFTMLPDAIQLTWNEALSGVTGSISLACWIFLLVPQLIENYQQESADGISLTFLFIWFIGGASVKVFLLLSAC